MKKPELCLEYALCVWESKAFYLNFVSAYNRHNETGDVLPIKGPLKHGHEFRKFLLSRKETFDTARFFGPNEVALKMDVIKSLAAFLPIELHDWSISSRRVYAMSEDLQMLLQIASLKNVCWSDITWPFPSFALNLPFPIRNALGVTFRTMLVSQPESLKDEQGDRGGCPLFA